MRFRPFAKLRLRFDEHCRDLERKAAGIVFVAVMAAVTLGIVLFKMCGG